MKVCIKLSEMQMTKSTIEHLEKKHIILVSNPFVKCNQLFRREKQMLLQNVH